MAYRFLIALLCMVACLHLSQAAIGDSCNQADTATIPGVIPPGGFTANARSVSYPASIGSIASVPACSPAIDTLQVNGSHWFSWTPTQDQTVFFTLTSPATNATSGPTNFPARLSVVRNLATPSTNCSFLNSPSGGQCLLRIADMCQGYPGVKLPSSLKVSSGATYFIVIDRPTGTSQDIFTLSIHLSPIFFQETFETASFLVPPTGWSKSSPIAAGSWTQDTIGFIFGNHTEVSTAPEMVFPAGPSGKFAAINPYLDCNGGKANFALCDQTKDYLISPNITFSGSTSAILQFDNYFYDGYTGSHQVVEHYAYIQISSALNSTWGNLFRVPSADGVWLTYSVSLDSWAQNNDTIQLRFWSNTPSSSAPGTPLTGWGIDNVVILNSQFDMCNDGKACTSDTCAHSLGGCINTPSNAICSGLHADCEISACLPFDVSADSVGCSTAVNATFCEDYKTCTNDTCNPTLNPTGNGCWYTEISGVCNDGKGCTQDICLLDPANNTGDANGCIFPTSCDDAIRCTVDTCITITDVSTNTTTDYCEHTIDVFSCDDGIDCTYELLCEVERTTYQESGCIILSMDSWCDDGDPCTIDKCDETLGLVDSCIHTQLHCDDEIACTQDYCNQTDGSCWHVPIHSECNDYIACTEDICDVTLGKCVNIPHDDSCPSSNCYLPVCDPAGSGDYPNNHTTELQGCTYRLIVCDDDIACTEDYCDTTSGLCVFSANHSLCVDTSNCTDDTCDVSLGRCTNIPNDANCNDNDACTIDTCGADGVCIFTPIDCSDDIHCTVDTCSNGICSHAANHTVCDDGYSCTQDTCDGERGCLNLNDDSACFTSLCQVESCNPLASQDATGCIRHPKLCQDELACTVDGCNESTGACTFTPDNTRCDDELECTVDTCDLTLGKCVNLPTDSECDDGNLCSEDICGCDGQCDHIWKDCSDEIACTVDTCDGSTGNCINTEDDSLCNDQIACTDDTCDSDIGKCTNIPNDVNCDDHHACTKDVCTPSTGGCVWYPDDDLCDDQVFCTLDTCSHAFGCSNDKRDDLCDDGNECTEDWCDPAKDCQHIPRDAWCDDFVACTVDVCGAHGCEHTADDASCDDGIECTLDYCDVDAGQCVHEPRDDYCSDGVGCTLDKCTATGCLPPVPVHDWCEDGFDCSQDICDATLGCLVNFTACSWHGLDEDDDICINCLSTGTQIHELCYKDGKGALKLQTKSDEDVLETGLFISPWGSVVVGAEDQEDVRVSAEDGLVVNGNVRITPVDELPDCNEVHRGLVVVRAEAVPCGAGHTQTCDEDVLYICLLEQTYVWREVSFGFHH